MKTERLFHDLLGLGMKWEVLESDRCHVQTQFE
jgi:hypothetical protein